MKKLISLTFALLVFTGLFSQVITPFSIRYQKTQKGGIRYVSNTSVTCTGGGCGAGRAEVPPAGSSSDNGFTAAYVDIDADGTTFSSSSDSLALPTCSEISWAGLYWGGEINNTAANYATRNQVRIKVNNGSYIPLTADQLQDNNVGFDTYHCFKDITALVQSAGIRARFTVANVAARVGGTNRFGGWTIVIVYKNDLQPMRNLTVFNGLSNVSGANPTTDITVSGFLTPLSGPVTFEVGNVTYDGDRASTGDQLMFNGGSGFVNISDAVNPLNDVFNSTLSYNGVNKTAPFINPNYQNTLGYDADIFIPNNAAKNYIGNSATSATLRLTTGGETFLTQVVSMAIDVYEPDLRAAVRVVDLNGGTVQPGDILEYTVVGKNIGSDPSVNTFIVDTLEQNAIYVPGSLQITYGPNTGVKTDASGDDQAEYLTGPRVIRVRVGTGANAVTGGQMNNSAIGVDSTQFKFRVTATNDCIKLFCDNVINNRAYIQGTGNISGNTFNNGSNPGIFDINGCPIPGTTTTPINSASCVRPPDQNIPTFCDELDFSSLGLTGYTFYNAGNAVVTDAAAPGIYRAVYLPYAGCGDTVVINITSIVDCDNDNDGILNTSDLDDDNDGIPDSIEGTGDKDGDGVINSYDLDSDNDGIFDLYESANALASLITLDGNGDGIINGPVGTNGLPNAAEAVADNGISIVLTQDSDGDGVIDQFDLDSDNDGISDVSESGRGALDTDNNGIVNGTDTDGDGIINVATIDNNAVIGGVNGATCNPDTDGDLIPNSQDLDSDNDGIADVTEDGNGALDTDNNGVVNGTDTDADGVINVPALDNNATFGGVTLNNTDSDGDGFANSQDLDSDNDGITDVREAGNTAFDGNNDGRIDGTDADGDGILSTMDSNAIFGGQPNNNPPNTDANGNPNYLDIDSDGDGIVDNIEGQTTAGYTAPAGGDTDGDGINNSYDAIVGFGGAGITPANTDGTDNPDYMDTDSDNDGDSDALEGWDTDNNGVANVVPANADADGDGLDNNYDANNALWNPTNGQTPASFPNLDNASTTERDWREARDNDLDGISDNVDPDDDNDGILDVTEGSGDFDGDGIPNWFDLDSDNDGIADVTEAGGSDPDNNGIIGNGAFSDSDNDGLGDLVDPSTGGTALIVPDTDGDGIRNYLDLDSDNDGLTDVVEAGGSDPDNNGIIGTGTNPGVAANGFATVLAGAGIVNTDADGDGRPNSIDIDSDNDGITDVVENGFTDADNNGIVDGTDADGDGILSSADQAPAAFGDAGNTNVALNSDGDTRPNYLDIDSDNDGITDVIENGLTDADNNGLVDGVDTDGDGLNASADQAPAAFGDAGNTTTVLNNDGDTRPNYLDIDSDNDGITDVIENGLTDADNNGLVDGVDTDGDGLNASADQAPAAFGDAGNTNNTINSDGDAVANYLDIDSDNDGITDVIENGLTDADNNGLVDGVDTDGDGLNASADQAPAAFGDAGNTNVVVNSDGDAVANYLDIDSDNDGITDVVENGLTDADNNGLVDGVDTDGDGLNASVDQAPAAFGDAGNTTTVLNNDGDTRPNYLDIDSDNDGITDVIENGLTDADNNGLVDGVDTDGDGLNASADQAPAAFGDAGNTNVVVNSDGDAVANYLDIDSDNDGITDVIENGLTDADNNGLVDGVDTDGDGLNASADQSPAAFGDAGNTNVTINTDGDTRPNYVDIDSDNDGITDVIENGLTDADNNGLVDGVDTDGDGLNASADQAPAAFGDAGNTTVVINSDGDAVANYLDLDSDNDGIVDAVENGIADVDNNGIADGVDTDGDGLNASADQAPAAFGDAGNTNTPPNTDANGQPNYMDIDADGDGIVDNIEGQTTAGYTAPANADSDGDGIDNAYDAIVGFGGAGITPANTDATDNPDYTDLDSDNDGDSDALEGWDTDNNGVANVVPAGADADNDGLDNNYDNNDALWNPTNGQTPASFPNLDNPATTQRDWREIQDNDGDGITNTVDLDDDNDGIPDTVEGLIDSDGDGIINSFDLDSDNDGITDVREAGGSDPDNNGQIGTGTGAAIGDSDNDGLANIVDPSTGGTPLTPPNTDGNGGPNYLDIDSDNDGIVDNIEAQTTVGYIAPAGADTDADGIDNAYDALVGFGGAGITPTNTDATDNPDYTDLDSDNDGDSDALEGWDTDNNGVANTIPSGTDSDNDGLDNNYDVNDALWNPTNGQTPTSFPNLDNASNPERDWREISDRDGDGNADNTDPDDDNDGIPDSVEGTGDSDGDGIPDRLDLDSDNDGITDVIEAGGSDPDNNGQIGTGTGAAIADTDNDGLADLVDIDNGGTPLTPPNTDATGGVNYVDIDADGDGIVDNIEAQTTAGYVAPAGADSDGDGIDNAYDTFVGFGGAGINPTNTDATDSPDYTDLDSDNDGDLDALEGWDTDNNGVANVIPAGTDSDNDGLDNNYDVNDALWNPTNGQTPASFPNLDNASNPERDWREILDTDGDGNANNVDPDDDNDGIPDSVEGTVDSDGDGIPNSLDLDSDNDGIADVIEAGGTDPDNNGMIGTGVGAGIPDTDNDGLADVIDPDNGGTPLTIPNTDSNGNPDYLDIDSDNDGIVDNIEGQTSFGYIAPTGIDSDNDGIDNAYDAFAGFGGAGIAPVNTDATGNPDYTDLDSDNDLDPDALEGWDTDNNGIANTIPSGTDADGDGLDDAYDTNDAAWNPTNGQTPASFPNLDNPSVPELDWRDQKDNDNDGIADVTDPDDDNDGIPDSVEGTGDNDGDGIPDAFDLDSDNDGIPDVTEAGGSDPDGDGIPGTGPFTDTDGDGLVDAVDPDNGGTPLTNPDTDGDGIADYLDLDSDNDGIPDLTEAGGTDANNDGMIDVFTDTDNDGLADSVDPDNGGTALPNPDTDGDGVADKVDLDSDNDGIADVVEAGGTDANGDGELDGFVDTDNDGLSDLVDTDNGGTALPDPDSDGDGTANVLDLDSDNDGITDVIEAGGADPDNNGQIGTGSGASVPDADNDGLADAVDTDNGGTVLTPPDTDGNGGANYVDIDSDGDGIVDNIEAQTSAGYIAPTGTDTDGDGIDNAYDLVNGFGGAGIIPVNTENADNSDYTDLDSDNDNDPDALEGWDTDNNGVANTIPSGTDADGDGLDDAYDTNDAAWNPSNGQTPASFPNLDDAASPELDWRESEDNDGDGVVDNLDGDDDNDGIPDSVEGTGDTDGDGIPDSFDLDSDNDGITDVIEAGGTDPDNNGQIGTGTGSSIPDTDNDGIADIVDPDNGGTALPVPDTDSDGGANYADLDSDNDGIVDNIEGQTSPGYTAPSGTDSDNDGIDDAYDTFVGFGGSGITPANTDATDLPDYMDLDSDNDSDPDALEGWDTDNNGVADVVPAGTDADNDGIDDAYDNNDAAWNPTNGQTPGSFPNLDDPASPELDWREKEDNDNDGIVDQLDPDDDNDGIPDVVEGTADTDGDGIPDAFDLDSDNDGIPDVTEAGGSDPDGDGIVGTGPFVDTDGDGLADAIDPDNGGTPLTNPDTDGDGIPDYLDLDSDNDGISDIIEAGGVDVNGDGMIDNPVDTDNDGIADVVDTNNGGTALPNPDTDGDGVADKVDLDSDNDGIADVVEAGGTDANGDGQLDGFIDTNNDGLSDTVDPNNGGTALPNPDSDGDGILNLHDLDSDNDGITDVVEAGGSDPDNNGQIGTGSGASIPDADNDGLADAVDTDNGGTALTPPDTDGNGGPNYTDIDSDGDGIVDNIEGQATAGYVAPSGTDTDGDGIDDAYDTVNGFGGAGINPTNTDATDAPDYTDLDSDNDGDADALEGWDTDNNGTANTVPSGNDADGDGLDDAYDNDTSVWNPSNGQTPQSFPNLDITFTAQLDWRETNDWDNDGIADAIDIDDDNDGIIDVTENLTAGNGSDTDQDGIPDQYDLDSDNDGIADVIEAGATDPDNDGVIGTGAITDADNDGLSDLADNGSSSGLTPPDFDGDGHPNFQDLDSDNDGINDLTESGNPLTDANSDGVVDGPDTDGDGIMDPADSDNGGTLTGNPQDFDGDGKPDYTDLDSDNDGINDLTESGNPVTDANSDGVVDGPDTDGDGINDSADANDALFGDPDTNDIPQDFDGDGNLDYTDLDSDNDGINDLTESGNPVTDANSDGVVDGPDADGDGISDSADATNGYGDVDQNDTPQDFDGDGLPDYTDLDSDNDGINDLTESGSTAADTNSDGVVDGPDADGDGIMDSADANDSVYGDPDASDDPADTDGDGLPNYTDLDSDNDGITDLTESGNPVTDANNDGVVDGPDSDGDGINDSADSTNGYGDADTGDSPVDTDNDGSPDYTDLDSDNDTIPDVVEGGNGGFDTDGDGMVDGPDADGDGIPDSVDNDDSAYGSPGSTNPPDTDNDGIPDYQDTDSDNDGIDDGNGTEVPTQDCDGDGIPNNLDPDQCEISIPQGFSPNGNGINDTFVIHGLNLNQYPNNKFQVFNRWGNLVYAKQPYDNSWDGTSSEGVNAGSNLLPVGTYFYVLDLGDGSKPMSGYIYLNR